MKWTGSLDQNRTVIRAAGGAGSFLYCRAESGGKLEAIFYMPGDKRITTTNGSSLIDDTWRHILIRVDGSTGDADIFIDNDNTTGAGVTSTTITGTLSHPNGSIRVMDINAYFSDYIITDGFHDPTDFADFSGANPCPIEPAVTPLIHYRADFVTSGGWPSIPDQSGNGYDGTFTGGSFANSITTDVVSC